MLKREKKKETNKGLKREREREREKARESETNHKLISPLDVDKDLMRTIFTRVRLEKRDCNKLDNYICDLFVTNSNYEINKFLPQENKIRRRVMTNNTKYHSN